MSFLFQEKKWQDDSLVQAGNKKKDLKFYFDETLTWFKKINVKLLNSFHISIKAKSNECFFFADIERSLLKNDFNLKKSTLDL